MKNTKELNVGSKLYKFNLNGTTEYEVFGIRKYANSLHYEIRCKACTHHYNCEVLIVPGEKNMYLYVEMLNEDEDYRQYYWHNDSPYFSTQEEALIHYGNQVLNEISREIENTKQKLKNQELRYSKMKNYIDSVSPKLLNN